MKFIKIFLRVLLIFFKINFLKTVYFNFKVLPLKQAIRLPIHFYGKTSFDCLKGNFSISSEQIKFGMISFGGNHEVVISTSERTRIYNSGSIDFKGHGVFGKGINLTVWGFGKLYFGVFFSVGTLTRIISFREIFIGDYFLCSWDCQIFDTDFHFISNDDKVRDNCKSVYIGNDVWIGTRVTILKGTLLPNQTIVGAGSLLRGDYKKQYGEMIVIGGNPAVLLQNKSFYIKDKKREMKLLHYYRNHQNTIINNE